ncbi:efflux RND transporter periplasmic adaptor subunit [Alicyclobacillus vulcanalis]|uniref:RND family efflux transporter, MFP subunit n=1 Tax=Alicyclobacillus vulcanalis TaxID=252246 RepID=A0A1N7KBV5_9BACL|nr:efflux RND transporter periplasmic adaptor subunit [Alicyclobacillus vulcanalis]SIS58914.1 RND family efflux transporter, MFP subunit [Alicyclobacillus vulcanalis]
MANSLEKRRGRRVAVAIALIGLAVVAGVIAIVSWRSRHSLPVVQTTTVTLQRIQRVTLATGTVRPADRQIISLDNLPAPVERVLVHVGEHVQPGQPLVQLSTASAEASVQAAQAALADAESAYNRVLTQYNEAPTALKALFLPQLNAAEASVASARSQLAAAQANVAQLTLTSTLSGIVLIANPNGVDADGNQTPVVEVASPQKEVVMDLSEVDAAQIKVGMAATMQTDAYPNQTFTGTVTSIAPYAELSQSGAPVVEVTVQPRGAFPVPYGYQLTCRLLSRSPAPVPTVPYSSIVQNGTGYAVYVWRNGHVYLVPVKLGMTSDTAVQVVSGLSPGALVVTNPDNLVNGEAVRTS